MTYLFLDPTAFEPPLGKKAIDRELKKLRQAIEGHPGLKFVEKESQTIGGFGRNDRFEYVQRFAGTGDIRNRVFVEAGTASGREPTDRVSLQSYVGQFLQETGVSLGSDDEGPFEMRLLHFRRTFVEKMFAILYAQAPSINTRRPRAVPALVMLGDGTTDDAFP